MNALVVGGSGCLGTALTDFMISEGHTITLAGRTQNNNKSRFEFLDLNNQESVECFDVSKFHRIYYLAQSEEYKNYPLGISSTFKVNAQAPITLAKHGIQNGSSFVYISTGSVYSPSNKPLRENSGLVDETNASMYAMSKILAEVSLLDIGGDIKIFRPFFIYGENARDSTLIAKIKSNVVKSTPTYLQGRNGMTLNPISSRDASRAIEFMVGTELKVINLAGSEITNLREIAVRFGAQLGQEPIFQTKEDEMSPYLVGDINLLLEAGFNFQHSIYE